MSTFITKIQDDTNEIEKKYMWFINWLKTYIKSVNIKKSQINTDYLSNIVFTIPETISTYNTRELLSSKKKIREPNLYLYCINQDVEFIIYQNFKLHFRITEKQFNLGYSEDELEDVKNMMLNSLKEESTLDKIKDTNILIEMQNNIKRLENEYKKLSNKVKILKEELDSIPGARH
jgi:predicted RNase H-like nuclease (RuvC/YqgF family)